MKQSTIQQLAPYIEKFVPSLKTAKKYSDFTNQSLADETGIPLSSIAKLFSDHLSEPKLYNSMAVIKALGLSADKLFGLSPSAPSDVLDLQKENAELRQKIKDIERDREHERRIASERNKHIRTQFTLTYALLGMSFILAVFLLYSLSVDSSAQNMGLIVNGRLSMFSVLLIVILIGIVGVGIAFLVRNLMLDRKRKRSDKT